MFRDLLLSQCEATGSDEAGGEMRRVADLFNEWLERADPYDADAEVWPGFGCNCLRWRVAGPAGPLELLYVAPDWDSNPVPTRSGNPVLFPFPNRIRAGRYTWAGRDYQLPLNDSTQQNAIHGFTPRHAWRVGNAGGGDESAFAALEFLGSRDAPECRALWPADYRLTLTWTLTARALTLHAAVQNPDRVPLPFGLGFHPYFRVPADGTATMQAVARRLFGEQAKATANQKTAERPVKRPAEPAKPAAEVGEVALGIDLGTTYSAVAHLDRHGRPKALELEGFPARVVQHENDHLDGVLTLDRAVSSRHIVKTSEIDAVLEEEEKSGHAEEPIAPRE